MDHRKPTLRMPMMNNHQVTDYIHKNVNQETKKYHKQKENSLKLSFFKMSIVFGKSVIISFWKISHYQILGYQSLYSHN